MEIKLREKLLVQKCLNTIIEDYKADPEDVNALINLKLDFLSFLDSNEPEEVEYGIQYVKNAYEDIYVLLGAIILEYQINKMEGSLYCKPVPSKQEFQPLTVWQKIQLFCGDMLQRMLPRQKVETSKDSVCKQNNRRKV